MKNIKKAVLKGLANVAYETAKNSVNVVSTRGTYQPVCPKEVLKLKKQHN